MRPIKILLTHWNFPRLALLIVAASVAACAAPSKTKPEDGLTGVSIQSLNYSAKEIEIIGVEQPGNPRNDGGGDALNPYSSGGTICCFAVPSKWHPDLKVIVEYKFYGEKEYRRSLVNVPPYPEGKVGSIWLMVHEDESAEAVVSHYGPTRPEWPGKVKGYPVPSREYRLILWVERVRREKAELAAFEMALKRKDLSQEEITTLKKEIEYSHEMIKRLEGDKP